MWQWENQYSPLAQTHRVLIPDLLGSGLSDKPEAVYSPENLVKFFHDFMDSLEIKQATLIGNSMGAGLAMAMALDYPNHVDQLVLISGFPPQIKPFGWPPSEIKWQEEAQLNACSRNLSISQH
jgi:pimeloyl-ACP methyl ester carboxylesterase